MGVTHAFPPRADTMPHKGGGDKAGEFFKAIGVQKQDTIRWSFNYGGISVFTRDDDGYTGLQVSVVSAPRLPARAARTSKLHGNLVLLSLIHI